MLVIVNFAVDRAVSVGGLGPIVVPGSPADLVAVHATPWEPIDAGDDDEIATFDRRLHASGLDRDEGRPCAERSGEKRRSEEHE
ncbi:hypothetical protein JCM18237_05970 [Halorubrum luteum]